MSTVAGLVMMLPQIAKNARLLMQGTAEASAALGILSWVAYSTGFLGNMLLLSYFTTQKEVSACIVQVVGAGSTLILLSQIYLAGHMPPPQFAAVALCFSLGCLVTLLEHSRKLPGSLWEAWRDFNGVLGLTVVVQVAWRTFAPSPQLSSSLLPGAAAAVAGVAAVIGLRARALPLALERLWGKLSGWTATLLFMLMPVAQLQACIRQPEQLAGMSALSSLLGIVGNGLMIPRALFTRDLIWFVGSTWGALMMGWGILLAMALHHVIPRPPFALLTAALFSYLATVLTLNARAHSLPSPLHSLAQLMS